MKTIEELEQEIAGWVRAELLTPGAMEQKIDAFSERLAKRFIAEAGPVLIEIRDAEDEAAHEPCDSEKHSWDIFRDNQVDSYWMRCHLVGPHEEHENSETGAKWETR